MVLTRRQDVDFKAFDDQSPTLWNSYAGNWTHYANPGFFNKTATATPTPGASLTFTFAGAQIVGARLCGTDVTMGAGSQAWLYGGLLDITTVDGNILSCPTADYRVDGVSGKSLNGTPFSQLLT
jgi:hypothetical protein